MLAAGKPDSVEGQGRRRRRAPARRNPRGHGHRAEARGRPSPGIGAGGGREPQRRGPGGRLLLFAVARQGDKVVAAGRGAVEHLKAGGRPLPYNVFFIGDPEGRPGRHHPLPDPAGQEGRDRAARADPGLGEHGEPCRGCGAPLAADQRYCLNCGLRRGEPRVDFRGHMGAANGDRGAEERNGPRGGAGRRREDPGATTVRWPPSAGSPCSA